MKPRILVCQNILTAIALQSIDFLDQNISNKFIKNNLTDLKKLYRILDSNEVILCLPLSTVSHTRLILEKKYELHNRIVKQITTKLLKLGNANFDVDVNSIIEQSNEIENNSAKLDFDDITNLLICNYLHLDYLIARYPNRLLNIVERESNSIIFKNFHTQIIGLNLVEDKLNTSHLSQSLSNNIFVYTPQYKPIELPVNSTPIDFAYAIHTKLGHRCYEAKVGNSKVSLNHKLRNGDMVIIIEGDRENPQVEWMRFAQTHHAKAKILHWHRQANTNRGWEIINKSFGRAIETYKRQLEYASVKIPGCKNLNDLAHKLGSNYCTIKEIHKYMEDYREPERYNSLYYQNEQPPLLGVENYDWKIAKCCYDLALPDEPLVGVKTTKQNSVNIHHSSCKNLNNIDDSQKIHVQWNCDYCLVMFNIQINDREDILRQFLNELAEQLVILDLRSLTTYPNQTFRANFVEIVKSKEQLENNLKIIRSMTDVKNLKIKRLIPGAII